MKNAWMRAKIPFCFYLTEIERRYGHLIIAYIWLGINDISGFI